VDLYSRHWGGPGAFAEAVQGPSGGDLLQSPPLDGHWEGLCRALGQGGHRCVPGEGVLRDARQGKVNGEANRKKERVVCRAINRCWVGLKSWLTALGQAG
jgi:hypothetical protein